MSGSGTRLLVVDANVLIDYVQSDRSVLGLTTRYVGEVYVISTVLDEVGGLDRDLCAQLGLKVVEPDLQTYIAATQARGGLSPGDHLCLWFARENGWTCVSNDGALRNACARDGVPVLWGLELMVELVRIGRLGVEDAIAIARSIHEANPFYVTEGIVERFARRLRQV